MKLGPGKICEENIFIWDQDAWGKHLLSHDNEGVSAHGFFYMY